MSPETITREPPEPAIELFPLRPGTWYSLDSAAQLSGTSRRSIVMLCRAGIVRPDFLPPYGVMAFRKETILALRQIEQLRLAHTLDRIALRTIVPLLMELESLRAEVRFWRAS